VENEITPPADETPGGEGEIPKEPTPSAEGEDLEAAPEPHPLEPGGKRFNQIYARAKAAEEAAANLKIEMARLEERLKAREEVPTENRQTIEQQLEAKVEAGEISQFAALRMLAEHYASKKVESSQKVLSEADKAERALTEAKIEIQKYITAAPSLADLSHERADDVRTAYNKLVGRGYKQDQTTELLALEQVFGSPERLKKSRNPSDRSGAPVTSGGGGIATTPKAKTGLEHVPARYVEYWKSRNYTQEQMLQEAKYLSPEQLARK
jgi:hypothetical protein